MAKARKLPSGKWHIQISVGGTRVSKAHPTKRQAENWAAQQRLEAEDKKDPAPGTGKTLADALKRYRDEVTPTKRGRVFEARRIDAFLTDPVFPHRSLIRAVVPEQIALWRDCRIKQVSHATVLRELTIAGAVFEAARREWRWVEGNPVRDIRKPPAPPHRERVISSLEVRKMLRALEWQGPDARPRVGRHAIASCFLLALQTGMRAGELCGLSWDDVYSDYCVLHSGKTKTGVGRQVPLTPTAQRVIRSLRGWHSKSVVGVPAPSLDTLFRRGRVQAGLEGFTFHDARHTAATRLAQQLSVLDLCKMFGWKSTTRALTYYNPTGSELAKRLSTPKR